MKICTGCKIPKNLDDFGNNKRYKDSKQPRCRKCQAISDHNHYKKDTKIYHNKVQNYNKKRRQKFKEQFICSKCSDDRFYILEFHHLDPTIKEANPGSLFSKGSYKNVLKEIEKCIPLCANCHREFHYLERENKINIEEYLKRAVGIAG